MPESQGTVLPSQEARQGETSGRMRAVLGVSLLLALIVMGGATIWWTSANHAPERPGTSIGAGSIGTTNPTPPTASGSTPATNQAPPGDR
jgi:hypothetical protein